MAKIPVKKSKRKVVHDIAVAQRGQVVFYDPVRDGVTFSLLSTFRDCREKARLYLQGWTARKSWLATTFGGIVHEIFQIVYTAIRKKELTTFPTDTYITDVVTSVVERWRLENPRADAETLQDVEMTMLMCIGVVPMYFRYWFKDFQELQWEALESEFRVPMAVRSFVMRQPMQTFLRGKIDGIFKHKKKSGRRMLETKTKSRIDAGVIADILPHELQVNIYMKASKMKTGENPTGILYNIIRRPQLRQKQTETLAQFAARLVNDVKARPDFYFIRMEMDVDKDDLDKNDGEITDIITDFLDWWYGRTGHYKNSGHCENKYGTCPMLAICAHGDYT